MNHSREIWLGPSETEKHQTSPFRPGGVTLENFRFLDVLEASHQTMTPGRYLLLLREHRAKSLRRWCHTDVSMRA